MADKKQILFRAPKVQCEKLNKLSEETGRSKQDLLHEKLMELVEDVELDDPRDELEEVREEKRQIRDGLDDLRDRMDEMRDRLDELDELERELEEKVEKHGTIGASSYSEAVESLKQRVVDGEIDCLSHKHDEVVRVAGDWRCDPEQVVRDVWEADPRVKADDVLYIGQKSYPEDGWKRVVGEDYEEAVELTVAWVEAELNRESDFGEGAYVYEGHQSSSYPIRVAEAHDVDVGELLRDAVDEMGEEFDEVIDNSEEFSPDVSDEM